MRSRALAIALATLALGFGATAASAGVESDEEVIDTEVTSVSEPAPFSLAHVKGTGGYRVVVHTLGPVTVIDASQRKVYASYIVPSERFSFDAAKRIEADFGRFGAVDIRFRARGRARRYPVPGCDGQIKRQPGVWKGELRFVGENGFTAAFTTRARGKVVSTDDVRCEPEQIDPDDAGQGPNASGLTAVSRERQGGVDTTFDALWLDRRNDAILTASVFKEFNRGRVLAHYGAWLRVDRPDARVNHDRKRARVAPAYPFTGEATYHERRGRGVWEGDLAVTLPAVGTVPLTGPDFRASLRRVSAAVLVGREARVEAALREAGR